MQVRQALFLVGDCETRLGSIAATTPTPLPEIAPGILDVLLEQAARHGFTNRAGVARGLHCEAQAQVQAFCAHMQDELGEIGPTAPLVMPMASSIRA